MYGRSTASRVTLRPYCPIVEYPREDELRTSEMRFVAVGLRFVIIRRARVCPRVWRCDCVFLTLRVQPGSEISGSNASRVDNGCFWSVGFAIF